MTKQDGNAPKQDSIWVAVAGLVVFVVFVLMVRYLCSLSFRDADASVKAIAAMLALGGTLVTAAVTLLGVLLKHSVAQRNTDLREEAEKRLKLEAAIRAVDLLGTDAGRDSTETQRAGAIFLLSRLGLLGLAVDLVRTMLADRLIDGGNASTILDMALRSNDSGVQINAAQVLEDHFDRFVVEDGIFWPDYVLYAWPQTLGTRPRQHVLSGLIQAILARPRKEWAVETLGGVLYTLVEALRAEKDEQTKGDVIQFLQEILAIYASDEAVNLREGPRKAGELLQEVKDARKGVKLGTLEGGRLAEELRQWCKGQSGPDEGNTGAQ